MSWGAIYTQSWWGRAIERGFGDVYEEYANPSPIAGLLSAAQTRSTYYENEAGTISLLQQLENCELVTTYGEELVVNGDFSDGLGWTLGSGWIISSNTANFPIASGSNSDLQQNINSNTVYYRLSLDLVNVASGSLRVICYSGGDLVNQSINTSDSYTFDFQGTGASVAIIIRANSGFVGSIDNVSVKEIIQTA